MLASIMVAPSKGLVANLCIPVTKPASPPSETDASIIPSHFVSKLVLLVRAHRIAGGGAAKTLAPGDVWDFALAASPHIAGSTACSCPKKHRASAGCARVSSLLIPSAV